MAVGDPILAWGTWRTLEANGAAITAGSVVRADDANYDLAANANWPDAEFVLVVSYSVAPTQGRLLNLLARPLDIQGTNDAPVPEAARPTHMLGSFVVDNVTGLQYLPINGLFVQDLPALFEAYVHNDTDQSVPAGWALYARGRNVVPSST